MKNTYKKLGNDWGAWIDTGYGRNAIDKPKAGDTVKIITKGGETHNRIVKGIVDDYASGCVVSLVPNNEIAQKAQERYNKKAQERYNQAAPQKTRKQLERDYDNLQNEGYSDGFNPYRDIQDYGRNIEAAD